MRTLLLSLMLAATPVLATTPPEAPPEMVADTPPPMPTSSTPGKIQPQPDIRVIEKSDATVTEFRLNGRLYQVKIVPKVGKPYYLVDQSGRGDFMRRENGDNLTIPSWVVLEF